MKVVRTKGYGQKVYGRGVAVTNGGGVGRAGRGVRVGSTGVGVIVGVAVETGVDVMVGTAVTVGKGVALGSATKVIA